jgi:DMSO/TMAO reductase YedYZ molybdopterin-dependent catalytic subunit
MSFRAPSPSRFRPQRTVDQGILYEHRKLITRIERRNVLRGSLSLGALMMLSGCNISQQDTVQKVLRRISEFNDSVQAALFDPNRLAPTYGEAEVTKPPRFNAHYEIEQVRPVDASTWRLELAGLISDKRPWTIDQINTLPQQEMIIRHICVEGWDYIGQWSGVNLRYFLSRIGADLTAKYVAFTCADGYYESLDMPTALHPQTILATHYAREPIADPFGYPLRLRTSTKLGYKNAKWITSMEVTNQFPGSYYAAEGFSWFAGL